MQKSINGLVLLSALICLSGCQQNTSTKPKWGQTLDLCELAAWQFETYPEVNSACIGAANADAILVNRLSKRNQCLRTDDFTPCSRLPDVGSENPSLDRARRIALAQDDQLTKLLNEIELEEVNKSWFKSERLEGWKKELDKNGLLKGKYANRIAGSSWSASEIDWLAYHAFSAKNSVDADEKLVSLITLSTGLADLGFFEEASETLKKVSSDQIERVLTPDWELYGPTAPQFSTPNPPYEERAASEGYRNTVAAIFAIQLHLDNDHAAKETLKQAQSTLNLMGPGGQTYIDVMEFSLGKNLPDEELFDKVFLGNPNDEGSFDLSGRDGLGGWESLVRGSALAPILKKRLDESNSALSGYEMKLSSIWQDEPNMPAADFLHQPPDFRRNMVFYKNLLKGKVKNYDDSPEEKQSFSLPKHVTFTLQNNKSEPVNNDLLEQIKEAGIGTYGVAAAREYGSVGMQIIYQSSAVDPSGETGIGGYWLLEANPETGKWKVPTYLGLRTLLPYKIDGFADDASINQDGTLQLIGARKALDLSSLTFPPIQMETAEPERGVIKIDMMAVNRDSDGDTLTDLFEARVGINPNNPDTDADGIRDNRDSVPTRTYEGTGREREKAYALLAVLNGHEEGAIVGTPKTPDEVKADPLFGLQLSPERESEFSEYEDPIPSVLYLQSEFEGLGLVDLPYLLIVQTEEEAKEMSKSFAPHYPLRITRRLDDPYSDRMIIVWSAGWVGGTDLLTRQPEGGYTIKTLSSWIT